MFESPPKALFTRTPTTGFELAFKGLPAVYIVTSALQVELNPANVGVVCVHSALSDHFISNFIIALIICFFHDKVMKLIIMSTVYVVTLQELLVKL
jgi:hypothetical protein